MSDLPDTPKRFIAGARCPGCGEVDRTVLFRHAGVQYRECVSCGLREAMAFEPQFRELETRVNRTAEERAADLAVVRLVNPEPDT